MDWRALATVGTSWFKRQLAARVVHKLKTAAERRARLQIIREKLALITIVAAMRQWVLAKKLEAEAKEKQRRKAAAAKKLTAEQEQALVRQRKIELRKKIRETVNSTPKRLRLSDLSDLKPLLNVMRSVCFVRP